LQKANEDNNKNVESIKVLADDLKNQRRVPEGDLHDEYDV
jgi:hypothetical protein